MEQLELEFEEWRPVVGYEGLYEVSNYGRVKSIDYQGHKRELILKPSKRPNYYGVNLCKNGIHKSYYIHRLVAIAFIPNPNNYPHINHINENVLDNSVENLEWCTAKYNCNYGNHNHKNKIAQHNKPIKCVETGVVYYSSRDAEKELKLNRVNILSCCKKKYGYKTCGGYHWEFA